MKKDKEKIITWENEYSNEIMNERKRKTIKDFLLSICGVVLGVGSYALLFVPGLSTSFIMLIVSAALSFSAVATTFGCKFAHDVKQYVIDKQISKGKPIKKRKEYWNKPQVQKLFEREEMTSDEKKEVFERYFFKNGKRSDDSENYYDYYNESTF